MEGNMPGGATPLETESLPFGGLDLPKPNRILLHQLEMADTWPASEGAGSSARAGPCCNILGVNNGEHSTAIVERPLCRARPDAATLTLIGTEAGTCRTAGHAGTVLTEAGICIADGAGTDSKTWGHVIGGVASV